VTVIAPKGGYDFAEKRLYRAQIWNLFRRHIERPKAAHVMLMPSLEGDEIMAASQKGFRQSNMHVVDFSPAVVATLKRRFPNINTYGVSAGRACARAAASGVQLGAANFDFTGCVSGSLLSEVIATAEADCYAPFVIVAMNMLRGREAGDVGRAVCDGTFTDGDAPLSLRYGEYDLMPSDTRRIKFMTGAFATVSGRLPIKVARGIYRSGNQTMLWVVTAFANGSAAVPAGWGRRVDGAGFSTDWDQAGRDAAARREHYQRTGELIVQGGSPDAPKLTDQPTVAIKLQRPR
jgi:hypothetical protein